MLFVFSIKQRIYFYFISFSGVLEAASNNNNNKKTSETARLLFRIHILFGGH